MELALPTRGIPVLFWPRRSGKQVEWVLICPKKARMLSTHMFQYGGPSRSQMCKEFRVIWGLLKVNELE